MLGDSLRPEALLGDLQRRTFAYFLEYRDPATGLVRDNTHAGAPCSITAVGLGLACFAVAAEAGWLSRGEAAEAVAATLRFFHESPQSDAPDATGYRGFYYHFLDVETGRRARRCELSTLDTTFLLAGALAAARYFDGEGPVEAEIRALADALYRRCDWAWALAGGRAVSHGWKPERGFLRARWQGYNEALLLYALALGSPTHPVPEDSYAAWQETYRWKKAYGIEHLYAGPLFIHQLSHCWVDFRGLQDAYMRERSAALGTPVDYFENSRRATYVQRAYATRNPRGFRGYGPDAWGITASDGPGRCTRRVDGRERAFYGYRARGAPWGLDDGTLSPWAVAAALPFAPEIVLPALAHVNAAYPRATGRLGLKGSLNPTFPAGPDGEGADEARGWFSEVHFGLDQGPVVLMVENYQTGLLWRLMRSCPYLVSGLRRAGFRGGWLEDA